MRYLKKVYPVFLIILILFSVFTYAQKSQDPMLYLSLGDFLLKNGYEDAALSAYNKALAIDPENKAVLNNLGFYYRDINPLLAEDYFIKALEADPEYEKAQNNLALLYNKLGDYSKASEQLKALVKMQPDNANYNYDLAVNLANKFYYQGRHYDDLVESIDYFKKVYLMDANFEHSLGNIKVLEEIRRVIGG